MTERLSDEWIAMYADAAPLSRQLLAREVQAMRALLPGVIEQLEAIERRIDNGGLCALSVVQIVHTLGAVIAELKEAVK